MKSSIFKSVLVLLGAVLLIAGCGTKSESNEAAPESGAQVSVNTSDSGTRLKIAVSFYPMYEFTKHVAVDLADVVTLVPAGMEPHDWEPTPQDMKQIEESNVLVYNGAGMESWLDKVAESVNKDKVILVEASSGIEIMQGEEEAHHHEHAEGDEHAGKEHGQEHAEGDEHSGEESGHDHAEDAQHDAEEHGHDHGGLDPHVWLAPALAIKEVRTIQTALEQVDPEHKDTYKLNADQYVAQLEGLDKAFRDGLAKTKRKDFVTQHAAFSYLAKEYGLTQVPIAGLSPEEEPSAKKMAEIVKFAKDNNVKTIFFETLVSSKISDTIAKEAGAKTAVLNPIEGLTDEDKANHLDYIGIMKKNLEALKLALNE